MLVDLVTALEPDLNASAVGRSEDLLKSESDSTPHPATSSPPTPSAALSLDAPLSDPRTLPYLLPWSVLACWLLAGLLRRWAAISLRYGFALSLGLASLCLPLLLAQLLSRTEQRWLLAAAFHAAQAGLSAATVFHVLLVQEIGQERSRLAVGLLTGKFPLFKKYFMEHGLRRIGLNVATKNPKFSSAVHFDVNIPMPISIILC